MAWIMPKIMPKRRPIAMATSHHVTVNATMLDNRP
jgi:hypothetical protein